MEALDKVKITSGKELWGRREQSGNTEPSFIFAEAIGTERTRKTRSLKIIINVERHAF